MKHSSSRATITLLALAGVTGLAATNPAMAARARHHRATTHSQEQGADAAVLKELNNGAPGAAMSFQVAVVNLPGTEKETMRIVNNAPQGNLQQVGDYLSQSAPKTSVDIAPRTAVQVSWNGHMNVDATFAVKLPYVSAAGDTLRDIFIGQGEIGGCKGDGTPLPVNGKVLSSDACQRLLSVADLPSHDARYVIGGNLANFGTKIHLDVTNTQLANNQYGGRAQVINISPVGFEKVRSHDLTVSMPVKTANTLNRDFVAPAGTASLLPLGYNTLTHSRVVVVIQGDNLAH
ncbi:hypothetical protein E3E12_07340 [Formicincola oecophyllae]|uniref:Uncharacterized protein n=1 Tax=Formicincola oecophyllae TaxID=2558361 RepID=A0A4Y6U9G5_9PROT|nr:hypothetical protein [Formicincola oecophyllae]QDH14022.1 hypothetical protein E3E12_07340 [Formicincola oecophyllae]